MAKIIVSLLVALLFVLAAVHNFRLRKEAVALTQPSKFQALVANGSLILLIGLAIAAGGGWPYFLLAITADALLLSVILSPGLTEEGLLFISGKAMLVGLLTFDRVKRASIRVEDQLVLLEVEGAGRKLKQSYALEYEDVLRKTFRDQKISLKEV